MCTPAPGVFPALRAIPPCQPVGSVPSRPAPFRMARSTKPPHTLPGRSSFVVPYPPSFSEARWPGDLFVPASDYRRRCGLHVMGCGFGWRVKENNYAPREADRSMNYRRRTIAVAEGALHRHLTIPHLIGNRQSSAPSDPPVIAARPSGDTAIDVQPPIISGERQIIRPVFRSISQKNPTPP